MDKRALILFFCLTLAFLAIDSWFSPKKSPVVTAPVAPRVAPSPTPSLNEAFYVLENDYQQLVFSTRGGSLAEINLPIKSRSDDRSIVKEVDIDRKLASRFPLHTYSIVADGGAVEQREGRTGGYYPLLRRSDTPKPHTYALNLEGDEGLYRVTRFEKDRIEFQGRIDGRRITKTFTLNSPYYFNLEIDIDGAGDPLWLGSGVPDVEIVGGSYTPLLRVQVARGAQYEVESVDLPKKDPLSIATTTPNWISNSNGFFGLILDPLTPIGEGYRATQIPGAQLPTRLAHLPGYAADDYPGYEVYLPLKSGTAQFRIIAGPFDIDLLKSLDALFDDPATGYNPDYLAAQSIQGWFSFISQPFAKFLSLLLQLFYTITHSWVASILLLTIALRGMMYPLNAWSMRASLRMQALAPQVKELRERYKKDPKRAQLEEFKLYRSAGASPVSGCLPLFLQMPFLFGMFYLLKSSFPLRGAPFLYGWINDLASPDVLFSWNTSFWLIGNSFHLLPVLNGLVMFIQGRLNARLPKDPALYTDAQRQQVAMNNIMSLLFVAFFYNVPSGLNLYFLFSNLIGILQQWWMARKMRTVALT